VFLAFFVYLVEVDVDKLLELGGVVKVQRLELWMLAEDGQGVSGLHFLRKIQIN
jgi:hypothetical protein